MSYVTHTQVEEAWSEGKSARRASMEEGKMIRKAIEADRDYFFNDVNLDNSLVEDCAKPGDCRVRLYYLTEDDKKANDWIIL